MSGARDQDPSPAGPVRLLSWSCRAPNCVSSAAHNASISSVTSANSATPAVRHAQVQTVLWNICKLSCWSFGFVLCSSRVAHCPSVVFIFNMCQYWAFTFDLHGSCVCNVCVFADSSPQGCVACDWGSTLKDKVCYPRCEEGRYFSEEVHYDSCAFLNFSSILL